MARSCADVDWDHEQMQALEQINRLPHWACVAYAARCGRQAQHALRQSGAEIALRVEQAVESALLLAEHSARDAHPRTGADETAKNVFAAGASTAATQHLSTAAAHAALAVAEGPEGSEKGAFFAFNEALEIARELDDLALFQGVRQDLDQLLKASQKENWTSRSPVAVSSFAGIERARSTRVRRRDKQSKVSSTTEPQKGGLGADEIQVWRIQEDLLHWEPGVYIAFARGAWSPRWAAVVAILATWLTGSLVHGLLPAGGIFGFVAGGLIGGGVAYWLLRRPSSKVAMDWGRQAICVSSRFQQRQIPFSDLRAVLVGAVAESPVTEGDPVEYSATLDIATTESTVTMLRGFGSFGDPLEACEPLETIAQWIAAVLDQPYIPANTLPDDSDATDQQLAAQQVALGKVALKRAKYGQQLGAEHGDRDVQVALEHFSEAHRLEPGNVDSFLELAELCSSRGDHAQAVAAYGIAIAAHPDRAELYRCRALSYNLLDNMEQAVSDYDQAIRLEPGSDSLYRSRGNVHVTAGNHDQAIADFTKCLELTSAAREDKLLEEIRLSNRAMVYAERADAFCKQGDLQRAQADVQQALELDPTDRYAQIVQAAVKKAVDLASADDGLQ